MLTAIQKIKSILETIPTNILPVSFQYLESMPASFPAAMLLSQGFEEEILDSSNNILTEHFIIRLIYPTQESLAGYEKMLSLSDYISAELRKDDHMTLDGAAIHFQVKQGMAPEYSQEYSQPVAIFGLTLEAKTIKSII